MRENKICALLGIKYPIIQAGMGYAATPELVAAVSNAGGLGVLAAGALTPDELRRSLRHTREMTDKPIGVNVVLWQSGIAEQMDVIVGEGVRVVMTGHGDAERVIKPAKQHGIAVIPYVGRVKHARQAETDGVDAVVAVGGEAGGHIGEISTLCLVPQVADAVSLPVIAGGGIGDGRGFAAAFALGASAVLIGTRFLATSECPIHDEYKRRILEAAAEDTVVVGTVTRTASRYLKNAYTADRMSKELSGVMTREALMAMGVGRVHRAAVVGDVEQGAMPCGQVTGMIDRIQTCQEIIDEIMRSARSILGQMGRLSEDISF